MPLCRIRDCNCSFLSIFWTVRCNSFTCFFERWFNFNEPNCFGGIENGILWTFNMYKTIELLLFFPVVYKVTYPFWAGKLVFFVFKIIWLVPGEFLSLDACRRCSKALRRWIGEIRIRFLSCRLQKLSWDQKRRLPKGPSPYSIVASNFVFNSPNSFFCFGEMLMNCPLAWPDDLSFFLVARKGHENIESTNISACLHGLPKTWNYLVKETKNFCKATVIFNTQRNFIFSHPCCPYSWDLSLKKLFAVGDLFIANFG